MDAVVLAGGLGTRLRPLTYHRPKSLLPIMNRPMVDHVVMSLPPEVDRVVLAVNYMADAIRDHLATVDLGREVLVVEEDEPLGTGGAFRNALGELSSDAFVGLNGDIVSSLDHARMLEEHRAHGGIGTIALWEVEDPSRYGVVDLDPSGRILDFIEKPAPGTAPSNLINAGAYVLEREVLELVEPGRKTSIEREVFPRVLDRGLHGHRFEGFWVDAGTPEAYLEAHRALLDRPDGPTGGVPVMAGAVDVVGPVLFGKGVGLGAGAVVGPHVALGDGCSVGEGAQVSDSVLHAGARVHAGARLRGCILGEGAQVGPGEVLEGRVVEDGTSV